MKVKCSGSCGRILDIEIHRLLNAYQDNEKIEMVYVLKKPEILCQTCIDRIRLNASYGKLVQGDDGL